MDEETDGRPDGGHSHLTPKSIFKLSEGDCMSHFSAQKGKQSSPLTCFAASQLGTSLYFLLFSQKLFVTQAQKNILKQREICKEILLCSLSKICANMLQWTQTYGLDTLRKSRAHSITYTFYYMQSGEVAVQYSAIKMWFKHTHSSPGVHSTVWRGSLFKHVCNVCVETESCMWTLLLLFANDTLRGLHLNVLSHSAAQEMDRSIRKEDFLGCLVIQIRTLHICGELWFHCKW